MKKSPKEGGTIITNTAKQVLTPQHPTLAPQHTRRSELSFPLSHHRIPSLFHSSHSSSFSKHKNSHSLTHTLSPATKEKKETQKKKKKTFLLYPQLIKQLTNPFSLFFFLLKTYDNKALHTLSFYYPSP